MYRHRLPEESLLIFEQIIEHSSSAIFVVDPILALTFANPAGEQLWQQLLSSGLLRQVMAADTPRLDLSTPRQPRLVKTRVIELTTPVAPGCRLLIASDITAEVEAQRAESLTRWRLEKTLELTDEGFWLWDIVSGVISHNSHWNRLFNFHDKKLTHHQDAMFAAMHPDDVASVRQHFAEHLNGRTAQLHCEFRVLTAAGTRWLQHHGKAVRHNRVGHVVEMLGKSKDITEKKRRESEMLQLAWQDPLTQLDNRARFFDKVELARADAGNSSFSALLYLDLNRFKEVNDSLGHSAGDELLKLTAQRLRATLRSHDTIARLGGDEFAVLVTSLGDNHATAREKLILLADRLLQNLEQDAVIAERHVNISSSIGIYLYRDEMTPIAEMLHKADMAQYYSKRNQRKWMFWSSRLHAEQRQRDSIESGLRRALSNDELFLEYQPQFSPAGIPLGLEALLRWRTPDGELVPPATFIPVAENSGLILNISEWVLEQTCRQLKAWQSLRGMDHVHVSVNISPRHLRRSDFIAQAERIVSRSGIVPQQLSFEILETALTDIDDVQRKLLALRDMQLGIALDNFGSGMASLTGLRRLGIDEVKIDRSLVMEMNSDAQQLQTIRAIIAMCQALDINIVAEGVESRQQFDTLCRLGCHRFQGWLFSRSLPVDQVQSLFM